MRFVLDASVTLSWLLAEGSAADQRYARMVLGAMGSPDATAAVPVTWGLEVANVLATAEGRGVINEAQSGAFLELLAAIDIRPDPLTFPRSVTDALQLARRHNLSAYDASYLELAIREGVALASVDEQLLKAARKAGVRRFQK